MEKIGEIGERWDDTPKLKPDNSLSSSLTRQIWLGNK